MTVEPNLSRSIQAINFAKVVSVAPGIKSTYSTYAVPSDKKFFSGIAGWKNFSGQGMEDLLIHYAVGTRVIIESAKHDTGKTWPPFPEVLRRNTSNTADSGIGRNYDRVSTTASTAIIDNWMVTANAAAFGWPSDLCTFVVENKSLHYTHHVLLFMSGTEFDQIDNLRGLPVQYLVPSQAWNQNEVNLGSERFNLTAAATKVFGPMPVLGLTHLKFLAYAEDQDISVLIEQGVDDRAATLLYRDSITYNVPATTAVDDEVAIRGKYVRVTVTNLSGASATDAEINMQMRSFF